MSLRLLLDEDISPRVAEGLRLRAVDAVSVYDVVRANRALSDAEQLSYAAEGRRVLVTYNRADFQALDALWRIEGRLHSGILWCVERSHPRRAVGELIRALEAAGLARDDLGGVCLPLSSVIPP